MPNNMADISTCAYATVSIFIAICTYILWLYKRAFTYWKTRGLEYIKPSIPFGNAYNLYTKKCTFGEIFAQWYSQLKERGVKHGGAYLLWKPVYIPLDPEIIKRILITDFENFRNRGLYINRRDDPLSGNIFTVENAEWKTFRSKIPAAFTCAKMRKMFLVIARLNDQFIRNLDARSQKGVPVNIKKESVRLTTDATLACMLGIETNTLNYENEEMLTQGKNFFDSQFNVYMNTIVIMIPRYILKKLKLRVVGKKLEQYFKSISQSIIDYRSKNNLNRGDLAEILIKLSNKDSQERDFTGKNIMTPLSFDQVTSEMCAFFSAGFETSSSVISFAMYELVKNPECQIRLREEIDKVLAKHDDKVTYDSVMEMDYLDQVVNETLRLYPVFPILTRVCAKDYQVPGTNITIEENTFVLITNMGIHRDPEYYPNPDQFDPERWATENKAKIPHGAYLPFGEGLRMCVGKRFGLMQTKLGVLELVRNYEITLNEKTTQTLKFVPEELILRKKGDIWINIKKLTS